MTKQIPLTRGMFALVDDQDFDLVSKHKWCVMNPYKEIYYACTSIKLPGGGQKKLQMHRLLLGDSELVTDHADGNGLNNTRSNIRLCTQQENTFNLSVQARTDKLSQYKGVSFFQKKWVARIKINNKSTYLGRFETESDAARAYDRAAKELFGEFARLNFPDSE